MTFCRQQEIKLGKVRHRLEQILCASLGRPGIFDIFPNDFNKGPYIPMFFKGF